MKINRTASVLVWATVPAALFALYITGSFSPPERLAEHSAPLQKNNSQATVQQVFWFEPEATVGSKTQSFLGRGGDYLLRLSASEILFSVQGNVETPAKAVNMQISMRFLHLLIG